MRLTSGSYLIVCPLLFLAGLVDSIGGGGGLISVPAFLIAGLPPHRAIATNKLAVSGGLALATSQFFKNKFISVKLAVPTMAASIAGSFIGAHISLMINEKIMTYVLMAILPVSAFFVLNKKLFSDKGKDLADIDRRTYVTATAAAFLIGGYDGFYGPGAGTFLIIVFVVLAKLSMRNANGQAKAINMATNITSLTVFLISGNVIIALGAAGFVCNMIGSYLGARLVLKNGARIAKPVIIAVLILLFLKITADAL